MTPPSRPSKTRHLPFGRRTQSPFERQISPYTKNAYWPYLSDQLAKIDLAYKRQKSVKYFLRDLTSFFNTMQELDMNAAKEFDKTRGLNGTVAASIGGVTGNFRARPLSLGSATGHRKRLTQIGAPAELQEIMRAIERVSELHRGMASFTATKVMPQIENLKRTHMKCSKQARDALMDALTNVNASRSTLLERVKDHHKACDQVLVRERKSGTDLVDPWMSEQHLNLAFAHMISCENAHQRFILDVFKTMKDSEAMLLRQLLTLAKTWVDEKELRTRRMVDILVDVKKDFDQVKDMAMWHDEFMVRYQLLAPCFTTLRDIDDFEPVLSVFTGPRNRPHQNLVVREGVLMRPGRIRKRNWQPCWVVLTNNGFLHAFEGDSSPLEGRRDEKGRKKGGFSRPSSASTGDRATSSRQGEEVSASTSLHTLEDSGRTASALPLPCAISGGVPKAADKGQGLKAAPSATNTVRSQPKLPNPSFTINLRAPRTVARFVDEKPHDNSFEIILTSLNAPLSQQPCNSAAPLPAKPSGRTSPTPTQATSFSTWSHKFFSSRSPLTRTGESKHQKRFLFKCPDENTVVNWTSDILGVMQVVGRRADGPPSEMFSSGMRIREQIEERVRVAGVRVEELLRDGVPPSAPEKDTDDELGACESSLRVKSQENSTHASSGIPVPQPLPAMKDLLARTSRTASSPHKASVKEPQMQTCGACPAALRNSEDTIQVAGEPEAAN